MALSIHLFKPSFKKIQGFHPLSSFILITVKLITLLWQSVWERKESQEWEKKRKFSSFLFFSIFETSRSSRVCSVEFHLPYRISINFILIFLSTPRFLSWLCAAERYWAYLWFASHRINFSFLFFLAVAVERRKKKTVLRKYYR